MTDLGDATSVAIVAAMVPELRPTIRALGLRSGCVDGVAVHQGRAGRREVTAVVTSMGTVAATSVTASLLDGVAVDHVIVIGICGAIDPAVRIGDLIVPLETVDEGTGRVCRPVSLDPHRPAGRLLTTDVLHSHPSAVADLASRGFVAVDMETAAIGAVCEDRRVTWSVFRAISDRAGDPAVDADLVGMSRPDGTADPRAVARYVARRPHRIPKMAQLGRGMRAAVRASTAAALAQLAD